MGKIKRKDNRFSSTKEKAKRMWGTFCVTQTLAGMAGLTNTSLAPSHTALARAARAHQWEKARNFQNRKGIKTLSYRTGPAEKEADTRGRHLCK